MKRYLLTSPTFKGHIEALYDSVGILCRLDWTKATGLVPGSVHNYKLRIPVQAENIYEAFKETGVRVEEAEFEVTFEDFIREYPYKRNTHLASAYWPKLSASAQYMAFCAAIEYRKYCERNSSWYRAMICETWLKKEEYKNDWRNLK